MYVRFKIFNRRIVFYNRKVTHVVGVNSLLKDGRHVPLIDCDEITLDELKVEVQRLLSQFHLTHASIVSTGRPNSYHVYLWHAVTFRKAIEIVAACRYTDLKHLHFSIRRGYFTLRISKKMNRDVKLVHWFPENDSPSIAYKDLCKFSYYETASRI